MASQWSIIARAEYTEGARSRWFLVSTLIGPIGMIGFIVLSAWLQLRGGGAPARIALVDESDPPIGAAVQRALEGDTLMAKARFSVTPAAGADATPEALRARVDAGELEGYLILPKDVARGGEVLYRGTNASSQIDMDRLHMRLESVVMTARAHSLGLGAEQTSQLFADVRLDARLLNGTEESVSAAATLAVAYGAVFLLYGGILLYGVNVMRSVVQEKSNRIVELLAACARPWDLMLGKVLGVGGLGLTQMAIWVAAGGLLVSLRGPLLAPMGIHNAAAIALPHVTAVQLAVVLFYFLGGFFLYASIFAAIGASTGSEREAQQAQMPALLPMIAAMTCLPVISAAPRGTTATALTLIPFFSPILMPMRFLLIPLPPWELAASAFFLVATIAVVLAIAARIYRVGILLYGKSPGVAELLRLIRER